MPFKGLSSAHWKSSLALPLHLLGAAQRLPLFGLLLARNVTGSSAALLSLVTRRNLIL